MPTFQLPYGRRTLSLDLDTAAHVEQILPSHVDAHPDPHVTIEKALAEPLGLASLRDLRRRPISCHCHQRQDAPRAAR